MPDNLSLRLTLMKALGAHLTNTIQGGDAYTHTLVSKSVAVGTSYRASDSMAPALCIYESILANPAERIVDVAGSDDGDADDIEAAMPIKFDVTGWGKKGEASSPADLTYELMADVKKACNLLEKYKQDGTPFGGVTIVKVSHDPGLVVPASQGENKQSFDPMFTVQVSITIVESAADPYRLN